MMLEKLLSAYEATDPKRRMEARRAFVINGTYSLLSLAFSVLLMATPLSMGGALVMAAGFIACLVILIRGRDKASRLVHGILVAVAMPVFYLFMVENSGDIVTFTMLYIMFLINSLLIGAPRTNLLILVATNAVFAFLAMEPLYRADPEQLEQATLIMVTVLHLVLGVFIVVLSRDREHLLSVMIKAKEEEEARKSRLEQLLGRAAASLNVSDRIHELTRNASTEGVMVDKLLGETTDFSRQTQHLVSTYAEASRKTVEEAATLDTLSARHMKALSETTAAVAQLTESIQNVARIAQSKIGDLEHLLESSEQGLNKMIQTDRAVQNVSEQAKAIEAVLKVIDDVASQTSLLAMNAAIEAAHAGESGRGFAVVAAEIRKLSEATTSNTKRIQESLKVSAQGIATAVNLQRESRLSYETTGSEMQLFGQAFREIIQSLQAMNTGTREISGAIDHIQEVSRHQEEAIGDIIATTKENDRTISSIEGIATRSLEHLGTVNAVFKSIVEANANMENLGKNLASALANLEKEMSSGHGG